MVQALPDIYLQDMNEIDVIIGQPLLFNYYTIFDVKDAKLGFYEPYYHLEQDGLSLGALISLIFFIFLLIAGILGCIYKY